MTGSRKMLLPTREDPTSGIKSAAKSLNLLIAEDSENDALLLVAELRRTGYDTTFRRVETPEAMRAALSQRRWDVVISDYTMPQFTGTEALAIVRKSGLDVPLIFVSGTMRTDTAVAAMRGGAYDYIPKGEIKRFVPAIERALREAELRRERRQIGEHVKRQQDRVRVLHDINIAINSTLDLRTMLDLLLQKIDLLLSYPVATTVKLFNDETGQLEPVAFRSLDHTVWRAEGWSSGRDLAQVVFDTKAPLLISDIQMNRGVRDPGFYRQYGLVSYIGIPLKVGGETLDVLSLYTKGRQDFNDEEIEFLSMLAVEAAGAIRNCQLYERARTHAAELAAACEAKSEVMGVISHELRTPFCPIVGYVAMVMDGYLGKINLEQRKVLARVVGQIHELLNMIESLIEASRTETAEAKTESQEVQLNRFFDQLRSAYEIPLEKEVVVNWKYPAELPTINVDARKLKHILQNLIDNAIKFSDKGRVSISVRPFPEKRLVEFKVSDTGKGIPKESLPFVIEMFRQPGSPTGKPRGGAGAGLYIVKNFTEILGGKVEVESEPGKGSTFTVTVPYEVQKESSRRTLPEAIKTPVEESESPT